MSITITWSNGEENYSENIGRGYSPSYMLLRPLREIDVRIMSEDVYVNRLSNEREVERSFTRTKIIEWWKSEMGTMENDLAVLNSLLSSLDMDEYSNKWEVTVFFKGNEVMTVVVEADSEETAVTMVLEGISEDADEVLVPVKYTGLGECLTKKPTVEIPMDWLFDDGEAWTAEVSEYTEA